MGTFGHIFGKSNDTYPVYTQGYLHLFLTVTATRSASSAETKEEIVSKYVIALNEVKWDTHKRDLWPAGCWPGQRRGLARGKMILLKVNSWNNSGASPQGRRPPICRLLRCKKEKGLQEVDTWIIVLQCSMNKTSRQKWSIHCCGTGESVAEVLNLLLTFFLVQCLNFLKCSKRTPTETKTLEPRWNCCFSL